MAAQSASTYDQVPYTSQPFAQTHPDRVASLAVLFGLNPPALEKCRVLELACASGGNLIPMALTMPHAGFVGIDLSDVQIRDGQQVVAALGLANVRLSTADIAAVDETFGRFDYIIAHGVYSWVPDDVQAAIFRICARQLTSNGIAFISYNTLPGWQTRGTMRDLMRYHAAAIADPRARVEEARAIAAFLADSVAAANTGYEALVKAEAAVLREQPDDYVLHEYLEDTNEALYFHQFIERAASHGLQYLADADFGTMLASNFPADAAQMLVRIAPGVIRQEQYMDFLRNRTFRQTLLVHADAPINRKITPKHLRRLGISGWLQAETPGADICSDDLVTYHGARGARLRTTHAIAKAAAIVLNDRWPRALGFGELLREAMGMLQRAGQSTGTESEAPAVLAGDMLRCFGSGLVQLHARASPFSGSPGDRPAASPLARLQARRDARVTNLRHEPVQLDGDLARLIQWLDGTRNREEIAQVSFDWTIANVAAKGEKIPGDPERFVRERVDKALQQLARSALLL
jgi:methyltransferase-like protein/SAM-dependent methyltransferase